ncbi:hypothetical protein [Euzebya sp.]|uniref:hypothetical protein n=1 Tax=Euzebya sp. TaxID=1971409 RepID=UPI00351814D1
MAERSGIPTDDPVEEPTPAVARDRTPSGVDDDLAADDRPVVTRTAHSLIWQVRIATGLAVLGLALAVFMYVSTSDVRSAEATRDAVQEAAEVVALRVTTFDGATIDEWVADTQELATGDYAEEVVQLFDDELRTALAENQLQSVGEITSSFVQDVEGDTATAFLVVRQTYTSVAQPQPVSDELRMEVELARVDGEWLAAEVAVLGPSTVSPVGDAQGAAPPSEDPAAPPVEPTATAPAEE